MRIYKIRAVLPKVLFIVIIMFGSGLLPFILMWIFDIKNYIFIPVIWGVQCFYYYIIRNIGRELLWLSKSVMDDQDRERYKAEGSFYQVISSCLATQVIKSGTSIDEIKDLLSKKDMWYMGIEPVHLNYFKGVCLLHGLDNVNKKDVKIILRGYGYRIPAPKLTLWIKDRKLVSFHDSATSEYPWHD